jgi:2,3-diaminopropionate biosynthesis protein SbnB
MTIDAVPVFKVISGQQVRRWLAGKEARIAELVEQAYARHAAGQVLNPDSCFLRFPGEGRNRIIALPASIEDEHPVAGIKWVASFPGNAERGLDRASAVIILNDRGTGYPLACLEGSAISATRTAASAAVGAKYLHPTAQAVSCLGVMGCGPIALHTVQMLAALQWQIGGVRVADTVPERAALFASKLQGRLPDVQVCGLDAAIMASDLVLFATSAVTPHVEDPRWFDHHPTVLHLSLRDLSPDIVLDAQNIADDVNHCLKADTSLHLAHQRAGGRLVAHGIADAIAGRVLPDPGRCRIYSPFGMGMLDLVLAREVLADASDTEAMAVPGFFAPPYLAGTA